MLALEILGGLLLTLGIAAIVVRHDASKVGWRRSIGARHLWSVFAIDGGVASVIYLILALGATGVWHVLATHHKVPSRTSTQPWSLLLYAITSGFGSLPLLGRRFPAVSKRLTELRESCVTTIQQVVVRKESVYHETVAVPALTRWEREALARRVKQWARNAKMPKAKQNLLHTVAKATDLDNRLTLCSYLYLEDGGPAFLDDLIRDAPKP